LVTHWHGYNIVVQLREFGYLFGPAKFKFIARDLQVARYDLTEAELTALLLQVAAGSTLPPSETRAQKGPLRLSRMMIHGNHWMLLCLAYSQLLPSMNCGA
jgi:hypothetical protein